VGEHGHAHALLLLRLEEPRGVVHRIAGEGVGLEGVVEDLGVKGAER